MRSSKTSRADVEKWIGYCILLPFGIVFVCLALVGDFLAAACFVLPPVVALGGARWLRLTRGQ